MEQPGPEAFDHLLGTLASSPAVERWGQAVFDAYVGQASHTLAAHVDALIELAGITGATRVLELGAGSGGLGCYVAARTGCQLEGVDWSEVAVRLATQQARQQGLDARVTFRRLDLREPDLPAQRYDAAIAIDATYFGLDLAGLAAAVARALCGGGRFALLTTLQARSTASTTLPGLATETGLTASLAAAGLVEPRVRDLTDSYLELVERMERRWRLDLPALRRELGPELADARLAEDERILSLLRAGALRRILCVARRAA